MVQDKVLTNNWHAVVLAEDLPPGKITTVQVLGQDVVVWRNNDQITAGEDRCPHRGTSFARGWVKDDNLHCPYHGFAFNTLGQCIHTPCQPDTPPSKLSRACFKTYQVHERYGMIWVCLGTPEKSVPNIPEWENPNYRRFKWNGPN
ncbi:MAG: Rieske (2Fe-2S) protein [Pseudanabaenales cyanobacterium]|nr:Rieske (2Fe-2S) protein [Pseudanabaenales cyanobacterium]